MGCQNKKESNMNPTERKELIRDIIQAIGESQTRDYPTDEELEYLRVLIKKEAQAARLREAIIEKTFVGLIWFLLVGLGGLIVSWLNQHGLKFN